MSTGTRKKKMDYKSMLQNDVDNEFIQSWRNIKTDTSAPKKNSSTFLGKKRQLSSASKTKIAKDKEQRLQKIKTEEKMSKLTQEEFDSILANYSEELQSLGLNPIREKEEASSLITDLNSLYYNLFYYTKFENSKPYKMIDYIISNDNLLINKPNDKERFEEIKKSVFSKSKLNKNDDITVVFKSLYEYFKTDFTKSFIFSLFEKINEKLQGYGCGNKNDETMSLSQEKKDKFTYSNYVTEKLRLNNNSLTSYTNDKNYLKSLIYLNNKSNRHLNKKNKLDKKLIDALKINSETISKLSQHPLNKDEMKFALSTIKNKKLNKFIKKRFSWVINCIDEMKESHMDERQFVKFLHMIFNNKEDECDKGSKVLKGDTKTLWICIKLIFYLHMLSKKDNVVYYTDNNFWKVIMSYLDEKKSLLNSPKFRFKTPDKGKGRKKERKSSKVDSDVFQVNGPEKKEGLPQEIDKVLNATNGNDKAEKEIEVEPPRITNPMEDIKQIVLSRYDNGEDVFLFTKEEKHNKKKGKEKEKDQEEDKDIEMTSDMRSDDYIQVDKDNEDGKPNENNLPKDTAIEKVRKKRSNPIKDDKDSTIKDDNVKIRKPRGRKKKLKEDNFTPLALDTGPLKFSLSSLPFKKLKRIKSDKSDETITSKTITDNGINDNPSTNPKEDTKPVKEKAAKIRIENPINIAKEGIFGIITAKPHSDIRREKEVIQNLTENKQKQPRPKKSKGRPRKNKIFIPIAGDSKQQDSINPPQQPQDTKSPIL